MQVLSPEGAIVRTENVVVFDDSVFIVRTRHGGCMQHGDVSKS
jgi:hypothetical protein